MRSIEVSDFTDLKGLAALLGHVVTLFEGHEQISEVFEFFMTKIKEYYYGH